MIRSFTKWSSTREPTAVFKLLETLYAAFDKIAEKRQVYKIESKFVVEAQKRVILVLDLLSWANFLFFC